MITMEKIFSLFVFAETFPNPTLVKLDKVKYKAVRYLVCVSGPLFKSVTLYGFFVV